MQVNGVVLSTKDKKTCACLTPAAATAEKENCCSSDAHILAEVQALYQLPAGHPHSVPCLLSLCTKDADGGSDCFYQVEKGSIVFLACADLLCSLKCCMLHYGCMHSVKSIPDCLMV